MLALQADGYSGFACCMTRLRSGVLGHMRGASSTRCMSLIARRAAEALRYIGRLDATEHEIRGRGHRCVRKLVCRPNGDRFSHRYLPHVLERIATHPINRIDELLPWRVADQLLHAQSHAA